MKKAVIWETVADVFLAGFILFIGISIFFVISGNQEKQVEKYFSNRIITKNNDNIFMSIIDAKIAQEIDYAHNTDEIDELKSMMDDSIEKLYSAKMCWILNKDGKEWIKNNACSKKTDFMDSTLLIPLSDFETAELNLQIKGYAK